MATAFKQVVHQNLECSVCLGFFKEPKILTCSHTFCKCCLETLFETQPDQEKLSCPVCRKETSVPDGDVSRLQTNIALRSLVADVETQGPTCANCGPENKTLVVVYCKDCSKYLCESCRSTHCKWVEFSDHSLVAAGDVSSGDIPLKRRRKCQKHPKEDEECFCIGCSKYVCFRCAVLEHAHEGHKVLEADAHEAEQNKNIDQLTCQAEVKISDLDKYVAIIDEQRERLQKIKTQLFEDIDEAYDKASRRLTEGREELRRKVEQRMEELEIDLMDLKEKGCQQIVKVNAVCGLVKNGLKVPLQREALAAHNTLCQDLEELLHRVEHDEERPRRTGDEGEQLHFMKSRASKGLELGQLRRGESKWILHAEIELPTQNTMVAVAISPDNTMAVACWKGGKGGIQTYSADGVLQKNILKTVKVRGLHFMSDGSYVVRNKENTISIYTPQCEKRDVIFETQSNEEGGHGGLTLDKDGHILSSYRETKVIQVFKPVGGRAVREVPCHGLQPFQICAMPLSKMIVVWNGLYTVRVIDGVSGAAIHSITKDGKHSYPAVCQDDTIIISWVKSDEGLVSIDHYTRELKHIRNLLTDFKITKPMRQWYYLRQFKTDEIAFCTPDRLYIFRETWE